MTDTRPLVALELPPDVETQIATEAAQKGIALQNYLVAVIRERKMNLSAGIETYLLSVSTLATDWLRPEEDDAWQDL